MGNEDTKDMETFAGLSAVLTGFDKSILAPSIDPVDIKSVYLKEWKERVDTPPNPTDLSSSILAQFAQLSAQSPEPSDQELGEKMLADSNGGAFVFACRQLIFLWYMGAWPTVNEAPGTEAGGSTSFVTLSSKSYTSGLVWQVMQSHPMGDSNYRYGYWAEEPAPLSDYTGHNS